MADVVIVREPLYGTVQWTGVEFIYTPTGDNTVNDSYTYKITDSTGTKVITKYVNPSNRPPIARDITVSVKANNLININLSDFIIDTTDPFDGLSIINVEHQLTHGTVSFTNKKIVYAADNFNSVQHIQYTVTDKEYEAKGTITINVIEGEDTDGGYTGSPYARFARLLTKSENIRPLTGDWSSIEATMSANSARWTSIDVHRYDNMATEVSGNVDPHYLKWNNSFLNLSAYNASYTTMTANSAEWNNNIIIGNAIYNTLSSDKIWLDSEYVTLTSNKQDWDNNLSATSSLSSEAWSLGDIVYNTFSTITSNSGDWDYNELNDFYSNYMVKWDLLYSYVVSSGNYNFWNSLVSSYNSLSSYIVDNNAKNFSTHDTLTSNETTTWDTTELNNLSSDNFHLWNNTVSSVSSNQNNWGDTTIISFSSTYYSNANKFNDNYNTVSTLSSVIWDTTELNNLSSDNFYLWNNTVSSVSSNYSNWQGAVSTLSTFSNNFNSDFNVFKSVSSTVSESASAGGIWDKTILDAVTAYIPKWDDVFHYIISTSDNTDKWDSEYSFVQLFSGGFISNKNNYESTYSNVNLNKDIWSDVAVSNALTSGSANWGDTYANINTLSSDFTYHDTDSILNLYNTISSQSGNWNATKTKVDSSSANWNLTNEISAISSQALTGSEVITLSTKDLAVYGNTNIKGNLSALGTKVTINTDVATTSSFVIDNNGTSNAVTVDKNGGFDRAILNLNVQNPSLTSTILYVKTSNSVGVNTIPTDPSVALTVLGNISASGYIYPTSNVVTTFTSNSAKYNSLYNYVTGVSSDYYSVTALSGNYEALRTYVNTNSNSLNYLTANKTNYDNLYSYVNSQSAINTSVSNFVTLCGSNFDVDVEFRKAKPILDYLVLNTSTLAALNNRPYDICVVFSYNRHLNSDTILYVVQDDIRINSWTIAANVSAEAVVEILSSDYNTYSNPVTITNGINKPHLDITDTTKNTSSGLSLWNRIIKKDSILHFNITNNTSDLNINTEILLTLNVSKQ